MGEKICTSTTLKTSLKSTLDFVNYHMNIGIDHMFLFFDDPKDEAIKILLDYPSVTYNDNVITNYVVTKCNVYEA